MNSHCNLTDHWALKTLVHEFGHAHHLEHWPEDRADIFDAWQRLPDGPRKNIEVVFQDIDEMATGDDGLRVILEESKGRGDDLRGQLEPMESRYDRVIWTYLNRPQIWDAAVLFTKADILSFGRSWIKRGNMLRGSRAR